MTVTVKFMFDKETAGTIRYQEIVGSSDKGTIGKLYVRKDALRRLGYSTAPSELAVTVDLPPQDKRRN
jgi:hypothetical protein